MDIILQEGILRGKHYILKDYHKDNVKVFHQLKGRYYQKTNEWKFPSSIVEKVNKIDVDNNIIESACSIHTEKITKIFSENLITHCDKSTQTGEIVYTYEPPVAFREIFQEYIDLLKR